MGYPLYVNIDSGSVANSLVRGSGSQASGTASPPEIVLGDKRELDFYFVDASGSYADFSGDNAYSLAIAISFPGGIKSRPSGGDFTLTLGGDTTSALPYNISASDLEDELNGLASVISAGLLDVTGPDGGPFIITFRTTGDKSAFSADASNLEPRSQVYATTTVEGDGSTQETVVIQLRRTVAAYQNSFTVITDDESNPIGWKGELNASTEGLVELLAGNDTVNAFFEIQVTDPSGNPRTYGQYKCTIRNQIIDPGTVSGPVLEILLTQTQADGRYLQPGTEDGKGIQGDGSITVANAAQIIEIDGDGKARASGKLSSSLIQKGRRTPVKTIEPRKLLLYLGGAAPSASAGVTVTEDNPFTSVIETPATVATYSITWTPGRETDLDYPYIDMIFSSTDWSNIDFITLRIIPDNADSGSYYERYIGSTVVGRPQEGSATWQYRSHFEAFSVTGTPGTTLTSNARIRIQVRPNNAAVASLTLHKGVMMTKPLVPTLIQFDDNIDTAYTAGFPEMQKRGITGTMYVITSSVGNAGRMTWDQLHEMQDAGWSICNHTHDHENLMTQPLDEALTSVERGAEELASRGFTGANYLGCPFNAMDSTRNGYFTHVARDYRIGLHSSGMEQEGNLINFTFMPAAYTRCWSIQNTDTLQDVKDFWDNAVSKGLAPCLLFHRLQDPAADAISWTPSDFADLLDYMQANGAHFVTQEEWNQGRLIVDELITGNLNTQSFKTN